MADQDRRWLAREVVRALVKALGSRNKDQDRAEFAKIVQGFVTRHGPLRLEADGRSLTLAGEKVSDEGGRVSRLAMALIVGGVKGLAIEPSVTEDELRQLVIALDTDEQDAATRLLDAGFANIEVGTFVFADRLEKPAGLATDGEAKLQALRERGGAIADEAEKSGTVGAGPHVFEVSDGAGELVRLAKIALPAVGDLSDADVPAAELLAFRAAALESSQPSRVLLQLVDVVIEGLVLDPGAVGETNARWFLEAAPAFALRQGDLRLLAELLERYMAELTASGGAVAAALNSVISGLASKDGLEKLIAIGTSGTAEGGPPAFCSVLEALGPAGVRAGIWARQRTGWKELQEALDAFLTANISQCPDELKPLLDPNASAETAKWALFLVSKALKGGPGEQLLESAKRHTEKGVAEYASFLWKTHTVRGRLQAFLEAIDKDDVTERIRAVEVLGRAKDQEALAPLVKLVDDPSFLKRPPEEMKAFLSAISAIGGPQTIQFFEKQAERSSGIFKIRAGNEVREQAKAILQQLIAKGGAP